MCITLSEQWLYSSLLQWLVLYSVLFYYWFSCRIWHFSQTCFAHKTWHFLCIPHMCCHVLTLYVCCVSLLRLALHSSGSEGFDLSFNDVLVKYVWIIMCESLTQSDLNGYSVWILSLHLLCSLCSRETINLIAHSWDQLGLSLKPEPLPHTPPQLTVITPQTPQIDTYHF